MSTYRCKNCGGNLIPEPGEVGRARCDSCFCISVIPSITDEQRMDRNNRGIDFRRARKFDDALAEFSAIVKDNPKDAQAHWDMMLSRYGINYEKDFRTGQYIPTCDRLNQISVYEDPDYKAALRCAVGKDKTYYQEQAEHIEKIRIGMMALAAKAEAYDVFICFKDIVDGTVDQRTEDSHFAHELYMELTNKGYRVFFSRVTLKQEHLGQEWEPVIYAALNTAKIMLVVGTSRANMESPWVKNEWTRFLRVREKDKTKSIITCYDSRSMAPSEIPAELAALEFIDLRDNAFYKYIQQTVFTHCSKAETRVNPGTQKSAANFAKRALQSLEDGDWDKADEMLEEALNLDPENGEAHLGKLLLSLRCRTVEALEQEEEPLSDNSNYARVMKYAMPERKNQIMAINQLITTRKKERDMAEAYRSALALRKKVRTSQELTELAELFDMLGDYESAEKMAESCRAEAERVAKEEHYAELQAQAEKQLAEKRKKEEEEAAAKRRREEAEAEARRKQREEEEVRKNTEKYRKKIKRKVRRKRLRRLILLLIIVGVIGYKVKGKDYLAAMDSYELAQEYEEQGDYRGAAEQYFIAAKVDYKDSEDKAMEVCRQWLGEEPVILSTEEYPWWGVTDEGGLTLDYSVYDDSVEFKMPTILDGQLVTGIDSWCFANLDGLKSLSIPGNYYWIGESAFDGCANLNSIEMTGVEQIGAKAFHNCDSLTNVVLPDSCLSVGVSAFEDCDYLINVTLNSGLESIGEYAFSSCDSLSAVEIPGTVTTIERDAFSYSGLSNLIIDDGVFAIGGWAFRNCGYLGAVTIPDSVREIDEGAFSDCGGLTTVVLGNGVANIRDSAFQGCGALTSVTFGTGLEYIGNSAFDGTAISGNVVISSPIFYIGSYAFYGIDSIYEVYVETTNELTVGEYCFYGCDGLNGAYFSEGLVSLEESAFDCCYNMTWVSLPEGLQKLGAKCFARSALYNVTFPTTLTNIEYSAFRYCSNLQGVHIPGGVTVMEDTVFADCSSLRWVWFEESISIMRDNAFSNSNNLEAVYYGGNADAWYYNVSKGNNSILSEATLYANYTG